MRITAENKKALVVAIIAIPLTLAFSNMNTSIAYRSDYFTNSVYVGLPNAFTPSATYSNRKTFIVFPQHPDLDPFVMEYNHDLNQYSGSVQAGNIVNSIDDNHHTPVILRDNDGYLHVFYGAHNIGGAQHSKSDDPDDISSWTDKGRVGHAATYPHPVLAGSDIYLFYRTTDGGYAINCNVSSDNGEYWSTSRTVIRMEWPGYEGSTWHYCTNARYDGAEHIHLVWHLRLGGGPEVHCYHARFNINDDNMYAMDGTSLGSEVDVNEANAFCRLADGPSFGGKLGFDENNNAHVIYQYWDGTSALINHTRWTGSNWTFPITITTTMPQSELYLRSTHDFIVNNASDIEAYLTVNDNYGNGGNIVKYIFDGVDWTFDRTIRNFTSPEKLLNNPQVVLHHHNSAKIVFSEYDGTNTHTNLKAYLYGDDGFVTNNIKPAPNVIIDSAMNQVARNSHYIFNILVSNNDDISQTYEIWTAVRKLPSGAMHQPLKGPRSITLGPGEQKVIHNINQWVGTVPLGHYRYYLCVGEMFPEAIVEDGLDIEIVP